MRNVVEKGSDMPAAFAAGGFDLDHIGPEVAEELAAELAGLIGEFEDPEAHQRAGKRRRVTHRRASSM